jgi:hypothetical protein
VIGTPGHRDTGSSEHLVIGKLTEKAGFYQPLAASGETSGRNSGRREHQRAKTKY